MPRFYWLDTNVLIEAHRGPYSFDIAPGFWRAMEHFTKNGALRSPMKVWTELSVGKDELAKWASALKAHLFLDPDQAVQRQFTSVATYVRSSYPEPSVMSLK